MTVEPPDPADKTSPNDGDPATEANKNRSAKNPAVKKRNKFGSYNPP
jgi:hypothetical protein